MKTVFYALLLSLVSCTSKTNTIKLNDLDELQLKGKVKSVYEYTPSSSKDKSSDELLYTFDEQGLLTFQKFAFKDNKESYSYEFENDKVFSSKTFSKSNNKTKVTNSIYHYSNNKCVIYTYRNGILCDKTIKKYDNNNLISKYSYRCDIKGNNPYLNYHIKCQYNDKNQLIKHETYLWKYGTKKEFLDWKDEYIYNGKESEPIEKKVSTFDEFPNKYNHYVFEYSNKYDEKGNWIEKVCLYKNNRSITKRKIMYYE